MFRLFRLKENLDFKPQFGQNKLDAEKNLKTLINFVLTNVKEYVCTFYL